MKNWKPVTIFFYTALLVAICQVAVAQQSLPAPRQEKLLNGLKILMWSDAGASKVTVKIRVHAGSSFDPQGREGVMQMLADNIFPNEAIRESFREDLGGSLDVSTNYDYIEIDASSKPESLLTMLETLSTAISNPAIDKEMTAKLRTALLAKVAVLESDPAYVADQAVAKRLFGTFPYGRPQLGTSESLSKIIFADLIDAKQRFLTADNATITISGNYDKSLAFKAIRRYFGSWLKADKKVPSTFRQPDPPPAGILTTDSPSPEISVLRFAVRGAARGGKDFAAGRVFSYIMEDRLKTIVPPQYAKDVFVRSDEHVLPGVIVIGFSVRREDSVKEKTDAGDVILKALAANISDAEFTAARGRFAAEWSKIDPATFWLDADTFQTSGVNADLRASDNVTLADANAFLEKIRKSPMAAVLVLAVPKSS